MRIYTVVTDVVNDVMYSRKSLYTCGFNTFYYNDVIHWETETSYEKALLKITTYQDQP